MAFLLPARSSSSVALPLTRQSTPSKELARHTALDDWLGTATPPSSRRSSVLACSSTRSSERDGRDGARTLQLPPRSTSVDTSRGDGSSRSFGFGAEAAGAGGAGKAEAAEWPAGMQDVVGDIAEGRCRSPSAASQASLLSCFVAGPTLPGEHFVAPCLPMDTAGGTASFFHAKFKPQLAPERPPGLVGDQAYVGKDIKRAACEVEFYAALRQETCPPRSPG
uniref:Uncharacterized protein n=1 Tax=Zooxanthella nutricula TaxID=1333877 RepID=A0A7S2NMP7_9DINO